MTNSWRRINLTDLGKGHFKLDACLFVTCCTGKRCSNLLKVVYAIINLFIDKNFMIALLVLYFNLLCSCALHPISSSLKEFLWCNCISIFRFRFGFGGRIFWKAVVSMNFVICQCSLKILNQVLFFSTKPNERDRIARFHIFFHFCHC